MTLEFHPHADVFPLLEGKEFDELRNDINTQGLLEPIVLLDGKVLDGRNRYRALVALGWNEKRILRHCKEFDDSDGKIKPLNYVIGKNIKRRHLTADDRKKALARLFEANPGMSTSAAAKIAGTSEKTAAAARPEPAPGSDMSEPEKRIGKDGKSYPVKPKKQPTEQQLKERKAKREEKLRIEYEEREKKWQAEEAAFRAEAKALAAALVSAGLGKRVLDFFEMATGYSAEPADELHEVLNDLLNPVAVTGNDLDPEAAAEKRKAEMAGLDG